MDFWRAVCGARACVCLVRLERVELLSLGIEASLCVSHPYGVHTLLKQGIDKQYQTTIWNNITTSLVGACFGRPLIFSLFGFLVFPCFSLVYQIYENPHLKHPSRNTTYTGPCIAYTLPCIGIAVPCIHMCISHF